VFLKFGYYGTGLTNQNSILEEIKRRMKSGIAVLSFGAEFSVLQFAAQKFEG